MFLSPKINNTRSHAHKQTNDSKRRTTRARWPSGSGICLEHVWRLIGLINAALQHRWASADSTAILSPVATLLSAFVILNYPIQGGGGVNNFREFRAHPRQKNTSMRAGWLFCSGDCKWDVSRRPQPKKNPVPVLIHVGFNLFQGLMVLESH